MLIVSIWSLHKEYFLYRHAVDKIPDSDFFNLILFINPLWWIPALHQQWIGIQTIHERCFNASPTSCPISLSLQSLCLCTLSILPWLIACSLHLFDSEQSFMSPYVWNTLLALPFLCLVSLGGSSWHDFHILYHTQPRNHKTFCSAPSCLSSLKFTLWPLVNNLILVLCDNTLSFKTDCDHYLCYGQLWSFYFFSITEMSTNPYFVSLEA